MCHGTRRPASAFCRRDPRAGDAVFPLESCRTGAFSLLQWGLFANMRGRSNQPKNLMSDKSTEERVKEIIVKELSVNPEQVTPTASFIEDLGADSLDTVELVMAFEEEFGVEVPDEEAEKLQTVGDVIKYIEANSNK